jgi:hypothetical protein
MDHLTTFFLYSLWFFTVSLVTVLWFVAVSDIRTHIRTGLFRTADLILMAAAVSVVAVSTITGANTVVRHRVDRVAEAVRPGPISASSGTSSCEVFSYDFTYSFGLERLANIPKECMIRSAESPR